jgi:hypothetical protein
MHFRRFKMIRRPAFGHRLVYHRGHQGMMPRAVLVSVVVAALAIGGCRPSPGPSPPGAERTIVWRQLGSWSGRGSLQTESFTSDTGTLRVRWEATPSASSGPAGSGAFRLDAHSAISGRLLQQVVDHAGAGRGIGYVEQDPHVFYVVVESTRLDWQFTVEEAIGYP